MGKEEDGVPRQGCREFTSLLALRTCVREFICCVCVRGGGRRGKGREEVNNNEKEMKKKSQLSKKIRTKRLAPRLVSSCSPLFLPNCFSFFLFFSSLNGFASPTVV